MATDTDRRRPNFDWTRDGFDPEHLSPFERFTLAVDWSTSPFGPIAQWSSLLRSTVIMLLADPHPAAILWGSSQAMIYNEAYAPLVGSNHPQLQGQNPRPIFGDLWDGYAANYNKCRYSGGFLLGESQLTMMTRFGYEEECYFSFKWAPLIDEHGELAGVYASVIDSTDSVVQKRRNSFLSDLADHLAPARDMPKFWARLVARLGEAEIDLPTIAVYTRPKSESRYLLEYSIGMRRGSDDGVPASLQFDSDSFLAPVMQAAATSRSIVVLKESAGEIPAPFLDTFQLRSFCSRSREVAVCPIFSDTDPICFMIIGLGPKKRFDAAYHGFLRRLSDEIISPSLGRFLLVEEKLRYQAIYQVAEHERNRHIRELEASETKYRQFSEHAPLGMVRIKMAGTIEYANAAWKALMDYEEGDDVDRPWARRIHPDDRQLCSEYFERVCSTRVPLTIEHRLTKTWRPPNATGPDEDHPAWILVTAYAEDDEYVVCWITDISAQKAAARALRNKMHEAILQRTRQENFIDMISHEIRNPMSAVLHCTEDITESLTHLKDLHKTEPKLSGDCNMCAGSLVTNSLESAETILYCIEHQKRIIDDVLTLSKLDAELLEIALIPTDPLMSIQRALKIFDRELTESGIELVVIEDPSLQQENVGMLMLDPNRFLQIIINLVTNAIKFTRGADKRKISVEVSASAEAPTSPDISYFPCMRESQVESLSPDSTCAGQVYLIVSVTDTGKGLNNIERQRLFQRFAQASPKTHIEYGGSGLGLFISRQMTELMGGQVGISIEREVGCTFQFYVRSRHVIWVSPADRRRSWEAVEWFQGNQIPLITPPSANVMPSADYLSVEKLEITNPEAAQSQSPAAQSPTQDDMLGTGDGKGRILVVEDNLINQKVLVKQLRQREYEVCAANHGEEAIAALQGASQSAKPFTIVLCDIEMPVMDGIACVSEIRRLEAQGLLAPRVPVIAVTANARSVHVERALKAGMDDVTTKPYRMGELVKQIEGYLRKIP